MREVMRVKFTKKKEINGLSDANELLMVKSMTRTHVFRPVKRPIQLRFNSNPTKKEWLN